MKLISILVMVLLTYHAHCRCSDSSSCFIKKLFDFSYPEEGVYKVTLNTNPTSMNYQILGYGDFNNDLRTDYVALGAGGLDIYYYVNSGD